MHMKYMYFLIIECDEKSCLILSFQFSHDIMAVRLIF